MTEPTREEMAGDEFETLTPAAETDETPSRRRRKTAIVGDYELHREEVIGQGAYAKVYGGRHRASGRRVAIKVLRSDLADVEECRKRFQREGNISIALDSTKHIVEIFAVDEIGGCPAIIMEYVEGRTLEKALREDGPFSLERALYVMRQLVEALEEAWSKKVVHRDLKPANILLKPEDEVKVADFGIARLAETTSSVTRTGHLLGSPSYMSPEQVQGAKDVDVRSDIYAAGCVFYTLLTGKPPFAGDMHKVLFDHVNTAPEPPSRLVRGLPSAVDAAILVCLLKDRDRRYSTPSMFREALADKRILDRRPVPLPVEDRPGSGASVAPPGRANETRRPERPAPAQVRQVQAPASPGGPGLFAWGGLIKGLTILILIVALFQSGVLVDLLKGLEKEVKEVRYQNMRVGVYPWIGWKVNHITVKNESDFAWTNVYIEVRQIGKNLYKGKEERLEKHVAEMRAGDKEKWSDIDWGNNSTIEKIVVTVKCNESSKTVERFPAFEGD